MLTVLSLGAGVQSSALLAMCVLGLRGFPDPDHIVFADTQDEPKWVYAHLEVLERWAADRGRTITRVTAGRLSDETYGHAAGTRKRRAALPVFTLGEDGREAMLPRQCTEEYKLAPIRRYVRQLLGYGPRRRIPARSVEMLVGLSFDERWRMKDSRHAWIVNRWPLIDAAITKSGCITILEAAGLPVPEKSACIYCPFHDDAYWLTLRAREPENFEEACRFDEAIRNVSRRVAATGLPAPQPDPLARGGVRRAAADARLRVRRGVRGDVWRLMLVLVSGATATMRRLDDPRFGRLIVPAARNRPETLNLRPGAWAMDNGAYVNPAAPPDERKGFKPGLFVSMLEQFFGIPGCLFVAAPDVVGSAEQTLAKWPFWSRLVRGLGYPVALVAQDGLTVPATPWDELDALFIGGTTAWKESAHAATLMAYAKSRGKHVHVGRVSTWGRLRYMRRHGADTVDTTGSSKYPDEMAARFQRFLTRLQAQPELSI